MSQKPASTTVRDFCDAMERIAPLSLAQTWDNVGLLAGGALAPIHRVLLTIDLTAAVVEEARAKPADVLMAYHPPLFKPVSRLAAPGSDMGALVYECIRSGMAIYATHTALDAAEGGANDVMAELCGAKNIRPMEFTEVAGGKECKFVVFVPAEAVDKVASAMFSAGAGRIGDYTQCSYRLSGEGTFFGTESTNPAMGQKGRLEVVSEVRLETVVPIASLPAVCEAMRNNHPYEEPAYDIYPLRAKPIGGIGRVGEMSPPIKLGELSRKLRAATSANNVALVGSAEQSIERIVVFVGAAGTGASGPFNHPLQSTDAIVTGEVRHHDALAAQRIGCGIIALGHWASERPALPPLADRLRKLLPSVAVDVSQADRDPFMSA